MKVRLPLSLLFACAASAAVAVPAVAQSASTTTTPTTVSPNFVYSDTLINRQWQWFTGRNGLDIAPLWNRGITGSGVVIGVMDAWVEPNHEDLNVSPYNTGTDLANGLSKDFVATETDPGDGSQIYTNENHGTFVAGMAAGVGGNDVGIVGAAPSATIAGLHIGADDEGLSSFLAAQAAYWASGVSGSGSSLAYSGEAAIQVIQVKNCSFGSFFSRAVAGVSELTSAIEATSRNNVVYVFAAGNYRDDGLMGNTGWSDYGNLKSVINVAATDDDGTYASFSSYGSNIFISAPGEAVVSTDRTGTLGYNTGSSSSSTSSSTSTTTTGTSIANDDYASANGTSFSAPIVSGVIALGKQVCSAMDVRWAKHALAYSSGHGESPNIDAVKDEKGNWIQESGYTRTETDEETGETTTVTVASTGGWQQNNGGYWFNNNYGFGMVDPEGFVDLVRDIAYTTVETSATIGASSITTSASTLNPAVADRSVTYSFTTAAMQSGSGEPTLVSQLPTRLETVSVTLDFSPEIVSEADVDISMNLNSLKVTLIAPDGKESVLVQPGGDPDANPQYAESSVLGTTWTFATNAFWGSDYSTATGDWQVVIEYAGTEDNTKLLSVSSVDFTMGTFVTEGSAGCTIAAGDTVNAHALALDGDGFTVRNGGSFFVEDSVTVNAGTLTIEEGGTVGFYSGAALNKGAAFTQNGGATSISGSATFARGVVVNGGTFALRSTISSGSGVVVNGGSFNVYGNADGAAISAGAVTLNGGALTLLGASASGKGALDANFNSSVTVNGGRFVAQAGTSGSDLSVYGGVAELRERTTFGSVSVGAAATSNAEARGGTLVMASTASETSVLTMTNLSLSGLGVATLAAGSTLTASSVSVAGDSLLTLGAGTTLSGSIAVSGNGALAWTGTTTLNGTLAVSGSAETSGKLVANGETTLRSAPVAREGADPTATVYGVVIENGGLFSVGKTTIEGNLQVAAGGTLVFSSRSRTDYDSLTVKGDFSLAGLDDVEETATTVVYDFGDSIPYEAELFTVTGNFAGTDLEDVRVTNGDADAWPTVFVENAKGELDTAALAFTLTSSAVTDSAGKTTTTVSLEGGQSFDNLHLYYGSRQTERQTAVQRALLQNYRETDSGGAKVVSAEYQNLFDALEGLNSVSALLSAYESIGVPVNLVAIDELHDKQAGAVTGAVSRRARELRSGFIRADAWSNPLFGNGGFSYAAETDRDLPTGFLPFISPEADHPLMIWVNGGYSASEADAEFSLSPSESGMLNVFMGLDYALTESLTAGFFAGYTNGRSKFDDGSRTEIQSRNIGVYLSGQRTDSSGTLYGTALVGFGFEEYDFTRKSLVGSLEARSTASPDGWQGVAYIEGGYEWKMKQFSTGPTVSLRYVANNIDGYTESSSDVWARQETDDFDYDSLQSSVGWRLSYRADFEFVTLLPELRASWEHEFLGVDDSFDARLALAESERYSNKISSAGDDFATVGAGLSVMLGQLTTLSFDYDMQFLRDDADPVHTFNAMFRTRF